MCLTDIGENVQKWTRVFLTRRWVILVTRTRRKKEKKIACPLLDVFAYGQISSPRLYRLKSKMVPKYVWAHMKNTSPEIEKLRCLSDYWKIRVRQMRWIRCIKILIDSLQALKVLDFSRLPKTKYLFRKNRNFIFRKCSILTRNSYENSLFQEIKKADKIARKSSS